MNSEEIITKKHKRAEMHQIESAIEQTNSQANGNTDNTVSISQPIGSVKFQDKFWTNVSGSYKIDPESLHNFLGNRGFRSYKPQGVRTTILVKIDNKRVREVQPDEIWETCGIYLNTEYEFDDPEESRQVKNEFHRSRSLFHKLNLSLLKPLDIKECKDTKEKSFLFFNDYVFEVTADSVKILKYEEVNGFVFDTDISNFNFDEYLAPDQKILEPNEPDSSCEFYQFIQDLCKNDNEKIYQKSVECLVTIIGYLIHRYKAPANAKAIILMDTYRDGNANGGTGKSLLAKGIGMVRRSTHQDGKFFASSDKFALSLVTYGTRIFIIDDVPRNFDFEKIFPLITEKAVVERKYENKFVIPFEESPKIVITTNYTVEGNGSSHKRRKVEFILSDTYSLDYSPEDKFKHLLFTEWNEGDWWEFYHFIIYCLQEYLKKGIVIPMFNVAERKLKMETTKEFIDYMNKNADLGVKVNKKTLYDDFYSKFPNHPTLELTTFTRWLRYFADAVEYNFTETHSGSDNFFEYTLRE